MEHSFSLRSAATSEKCEIIVDPSTDPHNTTSSAKIILMLYKGNV